MPQKSVSFYELFTYDQLIGRRGLKVPFMG
jgi:hypothetical protein